MTSQKTETTFPKRCPELDYLKTFAIILMVLEHSVEMLSGFDMDTMKPVGFLQNAVEFSWEYLCTALFLFSLGFGIAFTRKKTAGEFLKRAGNLMILAYAMNLVRSVLPCLATFLLTGELDIAELIGAAFYIDILHYAAIVYLVTALLVMLNVPYTAYLPIAIVLRFVSIPLSDVPVSNPVSAILLSFLSPVSDLSCFPFLNYYFYTAAGVLIGKFIQSHKIDDRSWTVLLCECAVLVPAFFLSCHLMGIPVREMYDLSTEGMQSTLHPLMLKLVPSVLILLMVFAVFHFLHKTAENGPLDRFSRFCGIHLNMIYLVHWTLLGWIAAFLSILDVDGPSFEVTLLIGLGITAITIVIVRLLPDVNLSQHLSLRKKG